MELSSYSEILTIFYLFFTLFYLKLLYFENNHTGNTLNSHIRIPRVKIFHLSGNMICLSWYKDFWLFFVILAIIHVKKTHLAQVQRSDKFIASFLIHFSTQNSSQTFLSSKFFFYLYYEFHLLYYRPCMYSQSKLNQLRQELNFRLNTLCNLQSIFI